MEIEHGDIGDVSRSLGLTTPVLMQIWRLHVRDTMHRVECFHVPHLGTVGATLKTRNVARNGKYQTVETVDNISGTPEDFPLLARGLIGKSVLAQARQAGHDI